MGFPQVLEPLHLRAPEVMNAVVRHVIRKVAYSEPGGISPHLCAEQRYGQGKQQNSDQQAQRDRHYQAFFVIRVLVVYTVKQKTDAFLELASRRKVKNIAVK